MANVEVFYWNILSSIELPFLKMYVTVNQNFRAENNVIPIYRN